MTLFYDKQICYLLSFMGALYFMLNKFVTLLSFMGALYFMINKFVTC